ncbi:hypothetical protein [uncultured Thermanaerothrix sp.]|uniref:hypothetical protein n=1 Tax=uncultured Thermanaerothrix sp. TaxID=1195149 RepID=UPI0026075A6E|nr:hypothetical protein [uncultured Thermanaerothrix sp.]
MSISRLSQVPQSTAKLEMSLFAGVLALGLLVRLVALDRLPLSEREAHLAWQAYALAQGHSVPGLAGQPGYLLPTALAFCLFGAREATARFWPALWGTLVVGLPWLLRRQLGQRLALLLALGLALDAGLVATSRLAAADSLALWSLLGLVTFSWRGEWHLAGIALALGILSGASFWLGGLILGVTWLLWRWIEGIFSVEASPLLFGEKPRLPISWSGLALSALLTVLLLGSGLGIMGRGLGAAATGVAEFLRGWVADGVSSGLLGVALLVYQPLGWVLALGQWTKGWRRMATLSRLATLWLGVGVVILMVYPGRQVSHLIWVLVPVWVLAASTLVQRLSGLRETERMPWLVAATGYFVLLGYLWLNLEGLVPGNGDPQWLWIRGLAFLGAVLLGVAIWLVVGWTWGAPIARRGLFWGGTIFLALLTFSATWQAAGLGRAPSAQIWGPQPYVAEEDLLLKTLGDVSEWVTGRRDAIDIGVVGLESDALRWALRQFYHAKFVQTLSPLETPSVVITSEMATPGVSALYRGQDFVWQETPAWSLFLPGEWLSWIIYRKAPLQRQAIIVWVRADRFPQVVNLSTP